MSRRKSSKSKTPPPPPPEEPIPAESAAEEEAAELARWAERAAADKASEVAPEPTPAPPEPEEDVHVVPPVSSEPVAAVSGEGIESSEDRALAAQLVESFEKLRTEVGKFIVGQQEVVEQVMIAILAGGHCLLEGVPGLAKTMLVRTVSEALDLSFRRIQFTPDLMPADITGTEIIQENAETGNRKLVFQPGPIFAQMILADEINRTPPKTQAALLEAMQEHRVTIGLDTYELQEPFFVLATQNPIEQEGTYPLPEAQKDRFIFHIRVPYPTREEEREIMRRTTGIFESELEPVLDGDELIAAQQVVRKVPVPDHVMDYVLDLVRATRPDEAAEGSFVKDMIDWGRDRAPASSSSSGAKSARSSTGAST